MPYPPHQNFLVFHFAVLCLLWGELSQFRSSNLVKTDPGSKPKQPVSVYIVMVSHQHYGIRQWYEGDMELKNKLLLLWVTELFWQLDNCFSSIKMLVFTWFQWALVTIPLFMDGNKTPFVCCLNHHRGTQSTNEQITLWVKGTTVNLWCSSWSLFSSQKLLERFGRWARNSIWVNSNWVEDI